MADKKLLRKIKKIVCGIFPAGGDAKYDALSVFLLPGVLLCRWRCWEHSYFICRE